jgi:hypothetical protein
MTCVFRYCLGLIFIISATLVINSCQSGNNLDIDDKINAVFDSIADNVVIFDEDSIPEVAEGENLDYIPASNITFTGVSKISLRSDTDSLNQTPRLLMLGDSHLMGPFGEHLQRAIHNSGIFDILSISLAGAGSKTFTYKMTNSCCGYAIRESLHDEVIPKNKKIRFLEYNSVQSDDVVSKNHDGRLSKILADFKPDLVLIALGNNFVNDHQGLIDIIRTYSIDTEIVWVGPMRRTKLGMRVKAIQKAVDKNDIYFVRSDDVIGHDTITTTHFYGNEARVWANTIFSRIEPLLMRYNSKSISDSESKKMDTLRF